MKLLRYWRQYDRFKAAVLLGMFAAGMLLYAVCGAVQYAQMLRRPAEYVCILPENAKNALAALAQSEQVYASGRQLTQMLETQQHTLTVTRLDAQYAQDCYALDLRPNTLYMNDTAFSALRTAQTDGAVRLSGTLDGKPISCEALYCDVLPSGDAYAVMYAPAAELHDAAAVRVCMRTLDASPLTAAGLTLTDTRQQTAAEYEQRMMLLRLRLGMLCAVTALLAAGANARLFRISLL